ncbi:MAG: SpoIID/LytB domain-containing protein [Solirubrobacteraceae bacterium]
MLGVAMTMAAVALSAVPAGARAGNVLLIRGGGFGHGIGMSQYGSYGYALHGRDYRFILAHYYQGTGLGQTDPNRIIRVLLADGRAAFSGATRAGAKRLNPNLTYSVHAGADGRLTLTGPSGKRVGRLVSPLIASGRGPLELAGVGSYRGSLVFEPDGSGGVQTVDAVGLEDYVRGVVSAEMPAGWPMQALRTQAVAARTYAITTSVGGGAYDVYADTRSQMYGGVGAETAATDAAVAFTRGQVVVYRGVPVVTYFSSSSGGHTENVENVWSGSAPEPWLRGVPDPYDGAGANPYHHWALSLSFAAAQARLAGFLSGSLIGISVMRRGVSPRILSARVVGTRGSITVTGAELEQALGLPSTLAFFSTIAGGSAADLPGGSIGSGLDGRPPTLGVGEAPAALASALHALVQHLLSGPGRGSEPALAGLARHRATARPASALALLTRGF